MTAVRQVGKKSEETRARILEAALLVFRERGFERATMREIATESGVAVGAAYYYFESKEAIVMAFYQRAQGEMKPALEAMLDDSHSLEVRLHGLITYKF
jgi:AcrR family transcriptional regulator